MIRTRRSRISRISWWWVFIKRVRPIEIYRLKCNFRIIKNSHAIGQVSKPTLSYAEAKPTAKTIRLACSTRMSRTPALVKIFSMLKMTDSSNDRTWVSVVDRLFQRTKVPDQCFTRISTSATFSCSSAATNLSPTMVQFHYLTLLYKADRCT